MISPTYKYSPHSSHLSPTKKHPRTIMHGAVSNSSLSICLLIQLHYIIICLLDEWISTCIVRCGLYPGRAWIDRQAVCDSPQTSLLSPHHTDITSLALSVLPQTRSIITARCHRFQESQLVYLCANKRNGIWLVNGA